VLLLGLFGFAGYAAFLPLYVDQIGVEDAGPFFLVYGVLVLLVRIFGARLPDRLGPVRASSIALAAIGLGIGSVAAFASVPGLWFGTVLLAMGMSLLFPALFSAVINDAPESERSSAVGTFSLFFDLSQGLGAPLLGIVVALADSYQAAFFVSSFAAVGGFFAQRALHVRSTGGLDLDDAETAHS
jgi:MFS family permease